MNRRGMSPLSSTLLLLAVSILIGILVMSWGKSYVEKATAKADEKAIQDKQAGIFEDLNSRLEKGEITKEQYDDIKSVLISQNS